MAKLAVGINVDIQRTNGRIHSAVVSSIDWNAKSVTVEWSESEEIKGKEVRILSRPCNSFLGLHDHDHDYDKSF